MTTERGNPDGIFAGNCKKSRLMNLLNNSSHQLCTHKYYYVLRLKSHRFVYCYSQGYLLQCHNER